MNLKGNKPHKNPAVWQSEIRLKTVSTARQKKVDKLIKDLGEELK